MLEYVFMFILFFVLLFIGNANDGNDYDGFVG